MKFEKHMKEKESGDFPVLSFYIGLFEAADLDNEELLTEMIPAFVTTLLKAANWLMILKAGAEKLGLRIKTSETIWSYMKKGGTWFTDMVRLISLYMLTDVSDSKTRKLIRGYAKQMLKQIDKKSVVDFLLQLDKAGFGITSHFRHILQSLFGIELTTYHKWLDDPTYISKELEKIKAVAQKGKVSSKFTKVIDDLEAQLKQDIKDKFVSTAKGVAGIDEGIVSEWDVKYQYGGRGLNTPGKTILWYYISNPKLIGLLWVKPDGTIMNDNKKVGMMIKPDEHKATHKRLIAEMYNKIGMNKWPKSTGNLRKDVENWYWEEQDGNVRGRIIGDSIFVWTDTSRTPLYRKAADKAVDKIYKYIDETLIEGDVVYYHDET